MTDPTTAIDTTRLRELLRVASNFRSQSMRTAALGVLRKEAAKALPALLDQIAAQAAEIKRVRAELERELVSLAEGWDFNAENTEPSTEYADRIDALRECASALRAVLSKREGGR